MFKNLTTTSLYKKMNDTLVGAIILWALRYNPNYKGRATIKDVLITFTVIVILIPIILNIFYIFYIKSFFPLYLILFSLALMPLTAVITRRFHDSNRSTWTWLTFLIPYIGTFIFLYFVFAPHEREDNIYGPNPR